MSRLESLARRLALFLGLLGGGLLGAGCSTAGSDGNPPPDPPGQESPAALMGDATTQMARLRALNVVPVRQLVLNTPEASTCYGLPPCPGSESSPAVATELARQVPRLTRLTDIAAGVAYATPADPAGADADIAALNALSIVEVEHLVTIEPANNPSCYDLPCPEDISAASAENQRRAGVLHAWATEAAAADL